MEFRQRVSEVFAKREYELALQLTMYVEVMTPILGRLQSARDLSALDADFINIRQVFEAKDAITEDMALLHHRLYMCLVGYLSLRGYYQEKLKWGRQILTQLVNHGHELKVSLVNSIAAAYEQLGDMENALNQYNFVVQAFYHTPEHPGLGVVCHNISRVHHARGNLGLALVYVGWTWMDVNKSGVVLGQDEDDEPQWAKVQIDYAIPHTNSFVSQVMRVEVERYIETQVSSGEDRSYAYAQFIVKEIETV